MKITPLVAYDVGVHIGDGNMYSNNRTFRITYSGNLTNEKEYYKNFLLNVIKKAYKHYDVNPIYIERFEDNTVLIVVNSKELVEFKQKVFNLPCGPKDEIEIPKQILKDLNLLKWCMRGIGDTDVSLSFKKNKKGINTEPRLELYTKSEKLINNLKQVLTRFKFTFSIEEKVGNYCGFMLRLYGKKNLENWLKTFGFSNPWIKLKIKIWKKLGYFPINKTYPELIRFGFA
jgi:hypothetical protein